MQSAIQDSLHVFRIHIWTWIVITLEQVLPLSVNVCPSKGSEYSHYTVTMKQREKLNSCLKYSLGGAFPGGAALKNSPAIQKMQETWVSIPGSRRSPGGGHGNPLQCTCLENPMDRGAWWAVVYGVTQSRTRLKWLSSSSSSSSSDANCLVLVHMVLKGTVGTVY